MPLPYQSDADRLRLIREFYADRPVGDVMFLVGVIDELVAALKTMVRDYEMILGDGLTESTSPPLLKDAHAAIAKAEGK
jgi:hypothetical protein